MRSLRTSLAFLLALLGLFMLIQLLLSIWTLQRSWFTGPLPYLYAALWVLAGLAGLTVALPAPRWVPSARWRRLAWWAGGLLLGFVIPGAFSIAAYMLVAATLVLLAAALRAWRPRYALEALGVAALTTALVLLLAWIRA